MRSRISELELRRVRYQIFTGDLRHHFSFQYWKNHWPQLVEGLNSSIDDQEFLRQDKATVLTLDQNVIGIHLLSEYDFSQFDKYDYFKDFPAPAIAKLQELGLKRVQALQYFMIDEKYSVANTLVNFGAIIGGLSLNHQTESKLSASLTIARTDIPVANLAKKHGFEELATATLHNVSVAFMVCLKPKPNPKEEIARWTDYYWARREKIHVGSSNRKVA